MHKLYIIILPFIVLFSNTTFAASCCGGGAGSGAILPKFNYFMWDIGYSHESFDGFWDQQKNYKGDPVGSDLKQTRLNLSYAQRLSDDWQMNVFMPLIHNQNNYSQNTSNTYGLGDMSIGVQYETFESVTCVYKINSWASLKPSVYLGATLTIPTGISAYSDRINNNQDITGRGFYRLDANILIEKTVYPYSVAWQSSYGQHFSRPINEEVGQPIESYQKKLGERTNHSLSFSYTLFLPHLAMLSSTLSYSKLEEAMTENDGINDTASGLNKDSLALNFAHTSGARDWIIKLGFNQSVSGKQIPKTTVLNLGVSHVY